MADPDFEIPDFEEEPDVVILSPGDELLKHFSAQSVSVSLKYYKKSCECFSD
jgi:hypothetical protein